MAVSKTSIAWTDSTWSPTRGCSRVSEGCRNCYAERQAVRQKGSGYEGLVRLTPEGPRWTGAVRLVPEMLDAPLRWREPRRIFVNSMSDLFHERLSNEDIAAVFGVMAAAPRHTFQCLTKRPERMHAFLSAPDVRHKVAQARDSVLVDFEHNPVEKWAPIPGFDGYEASSHGNIRSDSGPLKVHENKRTGRLAVTIWNHGEPATEPVHRLVLLAHCGGPSEPGLEVCHRNGKKLDNRLANLRWGTRSENQQEKVEHGARGGPAKLTPEQVEAVKAARRTGRTQQSVGDEFGVSRSLVSMIESGRVWAPPAWLQWPLPNVWLGVSVEDQATADARIPHLLRTPAAVRFVSYEPALGPVDFEPCLQYEPFTDKYKMTLGLKEWCGLDWIIVGGESGPGARPFDVTWARTIIRQCREAGVACFVKQLGANAVESSPAFDGPPVRRHFADRKGGSLAEWPESLRVRQFPGATP